MNLTWKRVTGGPPPHDPAAACQANPWPQAVIISLVLAGLISPLITLFGAVVAYALADQDQGTLLTGAGLFHVVLALTFTAGF